MDILIEAGKTVVEFAGIMSNPTYGKVREGAKLAKENSVDFILAVGGGSVSDCCKVVASQAKTERDIWDMIFIEQKLPTEALPLGVIVTASGTGSEQNAGAVITNTEKKIKAGLFCAIADFAILDPKYTPTVPMKQVISGAFDTLSHAMETYFGKPDSMNVSDEISEAVMRNVIRNMKVLLNDPKNLDARSELMWDSAMAVIHPILYRHIYESGIGRFARFAECVFDVKVDENSKKEIALAGINALTAFIKNMGLPTSFREIGITDNSNFKQIADSTNVTAGCCRKLSNEEIYDILIEAF